MTNPMLKSKTAYFACIFLLFLAYVLAYQAMPKDAPERAVVEVME